MTAHAGRPVDGFADYFEVEVSVPVSADRLYERVDYTFRFGLVGRSLNFIFGNNLVRKQVLDAHKRLREAAQMVEPRNLSMFA